MENISTRASSRRSSFELPPKPKVNPKYKSLFTNNPYLSPNKRLKINNKVLNDLTAKTTQAFNSSYLFKSGNQLKDELFDKTFCGVYGTYRGSENLVDKVSLDLAKRLPNYGDVSKTDYYTENALDENVEVTKHLPTESLILELQDILESRYGLQKELFESFHSNGKNLNRKLELHNRDTCLITATHHFKGSWTDPFSYRNIISPICCLPFQVLATAFPRTVEVLQEIMENILKSEWLKDDIAGIKLYLNEKLEIDRPLGDGNVKAIKNAIILWEKAKWHGDQQKLKDKKQWENVKDEALGVAISGGIFVATGNPSFIIGKLAQFTVNRLADQSDPHGQDKGIQALKTIAGAGFGGVMGGNIWDLGTALGVDLLDLSIEDSNKELSAVRGLGNAILKGALTQDTKKFVTQFLCAATAETARNLPESDENTPLHVRIMKALLRNSDVHAYYVGKWVDQSFKKAPKPKTDGILTPEEQAKYPKQQPTALDLEIKKAHDELIQKEAGVENAFIYLDDKQFDYDRDKSYHRKKSRSKLKKGIKHFNNAVSEKDAAFNKYAELCGDPRRLNTPPVKIPKKAGSWKKTKRWIRKNVSGSGEVTVGSVPLYQTKTPQMSDRSIPQYQAQNRPKPTLDTPQKQTSQYSANMGQWENVQAMQQQQMFEMNMAYRPPVDTSFKGNLDSQQFSGKGINVASTAPQRQMKMAGFAPSETAFKVTAKTLKLFANLFLPDMSHMPGAENPQDHINRIVTPEAVGNFVKSLPKGLAYTGKGVINLMLPDMSDVKGAEDPKTHFNRAFSSAMQRYDKALGIDTNALSSKAGVFVGEMAAFGGVAKVMRVAEATVLFKAAEGGFMGAIYSEAHETNKVAGIAFGAVGGAVFSRPLSKGQFRKLLDRVMPRRSGELEILRPALRSGLSFPKLGLTPGKPTSLAERNISKIRTDWVFPKKGGAKINGRWYTEHALERMAPRTPEVMAELEVRMLERAAKKGYKPQSDRFGKWKEKNAPNPRNIPPSVVEAEIAKPGSTSIRVELNHKGDVITVIPRR